MDTNLIKNILQDYRQVIADLELIPRESVFESSANYILTGIRRAGKSCTMYLKIRELIESGVDINQIAYVNFEDERLYGITLSELDKIVEAQSEICSRKPYYFFDEIQNVDGWEKFARRLADMKQFVWVTGSNSSMLSREMDSRLGGRFISRVIHPYSFREYLHSLGVKIGLPESTSATDAKPRKTADTKSLSTREKGLLKRHAMEYMKTGGFPGSVGLVNKREYIDSIFKKVYLGDIALRHDIRNDAMLRITIRKLAESVESEISFTRLHNILKSIGLSAGKGTVINYVNYAKEAYLIFSIENYTAKIAEKESNPKYYFEDNGLLNLFTGDSHTALLENLVAVVLHNKYGDGLYYIKGKREVDFFIPDEGRAIQVSFRMADLQTRERELEALAFADETLSVKQKQIITLDEEGRESCRGSDIEIVPLYRFLLE